MGRPGRKWPRNLFAALGVLAVVTWLAVDSGSIGRLLVIWLTPEWQVERDAPMAPAYADETEQHRAIAIRLDEVASGLASPTDMQFVPGDPDRAVVLEKDGTARLLTLSTGKHRRLFRMTVLTASEEGLLGLAFHPKFQDNGRFFINRVVREDGDDVSQIVEWRAAKPSDLGRSTFTESRVLMRVVQPYPNHDAGALAFGPDGYLYVGWGDGGLRDDPGGHGQNPATLLGSMLRIDVDKPGQATPYAIPPDNPFIGKEGFAPETWAYGLRNPWRYSFDPGGRLIVADVGQDTWEEIDIVEAGDNLGWKIREGFSCFDEHPECGKAKLVPPVHVYGREEGSSITGGAVYQGEALPKLKGHYVFGDFVSGKLFAIALPKDRSRRIDEAISLGKWPMLIAGFARAADGELYVLAFGRGILYKIAPAGG